MHFFPLPVIMKHVKQGGKWLQRSTVEQKGLNTRMNHNTQPPVVSILLTPTSEWWRLIHVWIDTFWFEHSVLSYDPLRTEREKRPPWLFKIPSKHVSRLKNTLLGMKKYYYSQCTVCALDTSSFHITLVSCIPYHNWLQTSSWTKLCLSQIEGEHRETFSLQQMNVKTAFYCTYIILHCEAWTS